jgi:hypothetical protein
MAAFPFNEVCIPACIPDLCASKGPIPGRPSRSASPTVRAADPFLHRNDFAQEYRSRRACYTRAVPSRQALARRFQRRGALDRVYCCRVLSPAA